MLRKVLLAKIHGLKVSCKNLHYEGSITIPKNVLELANIKPFEVVLVINLSNGARFETYVIPGDGEEVCLNGGAARLGEVGDELIVMSFGYIGEEELRDFEPKIIKVNQ